MPPVKPPKDKRPRASIKQLRFPETDIDDLSASFAIDKEIEALAEAAGRRIGLHERCKAAPLLTLRRMGRHLLSEAFNAATMEHEFRTEAANVEAMKLVVDRVTDARKALAMMLRTLSPADRDQSNPLLLAPLMSAAARDSDPNLGIKDAQQEGRRQAGLLLEALHLIEQYETHISGEQSRLKDGQANQSLVEKDRLAFVSARYWTFLTDKPPGRGIEPDKNPFLRFVNAVWRDLGGEETSFESAIKSLDRDAIRVEVNWMADRWARGESPF